MALRVNYNKFRNHLEKRGIFYTIWRGMKYSIFLVRCKSQGKKIPESEIMCGQTKITATAFGVKIYWREKELTEGIGLNTAIDTFGIWTDSSKAEWTVQESTQDCLILKCRFRDLPLTQTWIVKFESEARILWEIDIEIEEDLTIDRKKAAIYISPEYKTQIGACGPDNFPKMGRSREINMGNSYSRAIGIRGSKGKNVLPSLLLEFKDNDFGQTNPFVQDVVGGDDEFLIGAEMIGDSERNYFLAGKYKFFSNEISLFENERIFETKLEEFRRQPFKNVRRDGLFKKKTFRVFLANMPWEREGCMGVRAGSRWPHIKDKSEGNYLPFPFFLAYAASLLKENGVEVELIDALAEGISEEQFLDRVNDFQPDLLVAEVSTVSLKDDLKLLKKLSGEISIAICGPDVNIRTPEFLKQYKFVDYVLVEEYEHTLLELVYCLSINKDLKDVSGLIYRGEKEVKINSFRPLINLDILPWPLREELPMEKYWDLPGNIPSPSVQMLASRGCPFRCIYCLWPQVMYRGNCFRARHPVRVADEMEYLIKIMGFKSVYFDDDTWNIGRERILKFCNELKRRDLQNTPWAIMARPDLMDRQLLENLKNSGLRAVKYGVESGVQELIDRANKNMNLNKSEEMIRLTKELGIKVHLTFTFGLPGETKETIARTIDYALDLNPESAQFSIITPFPGTDYFAALDAAGNIVTKNWSDYDGNYKSVMKLDSLSGQDLKEAKNKAYVCWKEHQIKRRGFWGNLKKFKIYLQKYGFKFTLSKILDYLEFTWIKRRQHLSGEN